tara:strand:+ start:2035 stop:2817 length:783 start_codon:yes stop_codon:yes gene_type:complete
MRKKLYKFKNFKLLLEKEKGKEKGKDFSTDSDSEEDEEFDFNNFDLDENEENSDEENQDTTDDEFDGGTDDNFEEEEDVEEEEEDVEKVFNEDPSYYMEEALRKVERRLLSLFEEPVADENGKTDADPSSYHSQGVELMDIKTTGLPMNKTLIMKYHDNDFSYQLMITVDIKQGVPEKEDVEMDHTMIESCGVKFKKYDVENNLLGQLDRKKVPLDTIDQDFIDSLNGELDGKYSVDDNFEIEYGEKPKEDVEEEGADNE